MTEQTGNSATEQQLNVPLTPEVKRELNRISLYNSRTMRRQAAIYVSRCVRADAKRIFK